MIRGGGGGGGGSLAEVGNGGRLGDDLCRGPGEPVSRTSRAASSAWAWTGVIEVEARRPRLRMITSSGLTTRSSQGRRMFWFSLRTENNEKEKVTTSSSRTTQLNFHQITHLPPLLLKGELDDGGVAAEPAHKVQHRLQLLITFLGRIFLRTLAHLRQHQQPIPVLLVGRVLARLELNGLVADYGVAGDQTGQTLTSVGIDETCLVHFALSKRIHRQRLRQLRVHGHLQNPALHPLYYLLIVVRGRRQRNFVRNVRSHKVRVIHVEVVLFNGIEKIKKVIKEDEGHFGAVGPPGGHARLVEGLVGANHVGVAQQRDRYLQVEFAEVRNAAFTSTTTTISTPFLLSDHRLQNRLLRQVVRDEEVLLEETSLDDIEARVGGQEGAEAVSKSRVNRSSLPTFTAKTFTSLS
ncbi:hypothetical protein TYRP_019778 [Tyrophagus putrescentiae]|nr:hypothetical protein TYRP_019778 [Tyrophagus putrescentiae]